MGLLSLLDCFRAYADTGDLVSDFIGGGAALLRLRSVTSGAATCTPSLLTCRYCRWSPRTRPEEALSSFVVALRGALAHTFHKEDVKNRQHRPDRGLVRAAAQHICVDDGPTDEVTGEAGFGEILNLYLSSVDIDGEVNFSVDHVLVEFNPTQLMAGFCLAYELLSELTGRVILRLHNFAPESVPDTIGMATSLIADNVGSAEAQINLFLPAKVVMTAEMVTAWTGHLENSKRENPRSENNRTQVSFCVAEAEGRFGGTDKEDEKSDNAAAATPKKFCFTLT